MEIENNLNGKRKQDKLYKYAQHVLSAQIDCKAKALLWFYAYVFNWENGRPSFYSQERICAYVGMSPKTYHKARKYLLELGWVQIKSRGYSNPPLVWVKIGENDPNYKNHTYAAGHPDVQGFDLDEIDPFKYEGFDPLSA